MTENLYSRVIGPPLKFIQIRDGYMKIGTILVSEVLEQMWTQAPYRSVMVVLLEVKERVSCQMNIVWSRTLVPYNGKPTEF